jgi:hypothetical protein
MPAKKRPVSKAKTATKAKAVTKTKPKTKKNKNVATPRNDYDKPMNLAIAGFIGVILSYILISRALNTGSYWEYLFGLIVIFIAIRLFIRSIKLV